MRRGDDDDAPSPDILSRRRRGKRILDVAATVRHVLMR